MSNTPNHSERGHHAQGPSQLKALKICPGFENTPGDSEASIKGTRIHEALEVQDPSHLLNEEEVAIYEYCIRAEDKLIADYFGDTPYTRYNELSLTIPLNGGEEIWGTGDVLCIADDGSNGLGIDYKTGRMKVDDALVNLQAKAYKNGAYHLYPSMATFRFAFIAPVLDLVDAADFEPESVAIDRQHMTEIVYRARDTIRKWKLAEVTAEDLTSSGQCTFCRHATYCPAIHDIGISVGRELGIPVPDLQDPNPTPELIAQRYTLAKLLEPVIDAYKRQGVDAAKEGEYLPGWELRSMGSSRVVSDQDSLVELCAAHGITSDDILKLSKIPFAKVRNLVGSKAPKGKKTALMKSFEKEGLDSHAITMGTERFTLKIETQD